MIHDIQNRSFNQLSFHNGRNYFYERFPGKNDSSLGNRVNAAGKPEGAQVFQKVFIKHMQTLQITDVIGGKLQVFNVFDNLFQTAGDRISAAGRIFSVKCVKITISLLPVLKYPCIMVISYRSVRSVRFNDLMVLFWQVESAFSSPVLVLDKSVLRIVYSFFTEVAPFFCIFCIFLRTDLTF